MLVGKTTPKCPKNFIRKTSVKAQTLKNNSNHINIFYKFTSLAGFNSIKAIVFGKLVSPNTIANKDLSMRQ